MTLIRMREQTLTLSGKKIGGVERRKSCQRPFSHYQKNELFEEIVNSTVQESKHHFSPVLKDILSAYQDKMCSVL